LYYANVQIKLTHGVTHRTEASGLNKICRSESDAYVMISRIPVMSYLCFINMTGRIQKKYIYAKVE